MKGLVDHPTGSKLTYYQFKITSKFVDNRIMIKYNLLTDTLNLKLNCKTNELTKFPPGWKMNTRHELTANGNIVKERDNIEA